MLKGKSFIAIIPARSGSKRLPGKNTMKLAGKPLIAWTIQAAIESKYIDRVVVSTDSDQIANLSKKHGADVPYLRPEILARDESPTIDAVLHMLNYLEKRGEFYDYVVLLQPTSPLRNARDINESIDLLFDRESDAVVSVCKAEHSPLWCGKLPLDMDMSNFLDIAVINKRSQDLDQYHRLNGAIYLCSVNRLKKEKVFILKSRCIAYEMDQDKSIDIDSHLDFDFAYFCMKKHK